MPPKNSGTGKKGKREKGERKEVGGKRAKRIGLNAEQQVAGRS
jgi:hypothetical protein